VEAPEAGAARQVPWQLGAAVAAALVGAVPWLQL
jgi:hypothetical protein